jgi:hypothetical protein
MNGVIQTSMATGKATKQHTSGALWWTKFSVPMTKTKALAA